MKSVMVLLPTSLPLVVLLLCKTSHAFVSRSSNTFANRKITINHYIPSNREVIGAESIFSRAKVMRRNQLKRISNRWKQRKSKTQRGKQGDSPAISTTTADPKDVNNADMLLVLENISERDIAKIALDLPSWAATNTSERRNLQVMKILLQNEYQTLQRHKITKKNGKVMSIVQAFPDVYSDFRLLRFLRKEKQDPMAAAKRFQEFLQWRKDNNIDVLIRNHIPDLTDDDNDDHFPSFVSPYIEQQQVAKHMPAEFYIENSQNEISSSSSSSTKEAKKKTINIKKMNKNSNKATVNDNDSPLSILLHVGKWDTTTLTKLVQNQQLSIESFLNYWTYIFESIHVYLYHQSMKHEKVMFIDEICNLQQLSLQQFTPNFMSTVLKPWLQLTQAYYPETTKHIVMLQPPRFMRLVWDLLTPMISASTVAKIQFIAKQDSSKFMQSMQSNHEEVQAYASNYS